MRRYVTKNSAETKLIGERLGRKLKPPALLVLRSPLGGGKTVLVQGFARGLGIKERVISPTFVLERIYKVPRKDYLLYHYDLYRIDPDDPLIDEILENAKNNIVAVEWGEKLGRPLPRSATKIAIRIQPNDRRKVIIA